MKPTVKSYFSGAGGLDLGLMQAGCDVIQSLEYDTICCETLRKNFGHSVVSKDITGKHSEKPHYFRELIVKSTEKTFVEPNRLELFARDKDGLFPTDHLTGWSVFGNQVTNSIR